MNDCRLNALLEEYRILCANIDAHSRIPYQVLPICAAVGVVFGVNKVQEPGLAAIVFAYGISLVVLSLAFVHSMIMGIGLRLVKLELLINEAIGANENNGIAWHKSTLAEHYRPFPGFRLYILLAMILGVSALSLCVASGWVGLREQLHLSIFGAVVFTSLPVALSLLACGLAYLVERRVRDKKQRILAGDEDQP